ncbi:MAG: DNA repair protein RadA [Syntrophomonadaceae bacterium]|jgi:DNA repair protein RadA/Sms
MGKNTSRFACQECGYETYKWMGKCPGCGQWNTLLEEIQSSQDKPLGHIETPALPLNSISGSDTYRYSSGLGELDRVLGGGIVPGSLVLLGGDPGIGKSTLLLQAADKIARSGKRVLYLSGEESLRQIRLRADRLQIESSDIFLLNEPNIEILEEYIREIGPDFVIIDSIQTVYLEHISSIPGSVAQLRECTAAIMRLAKKNDIAFFVVGHVTKDGMLAGPRMLEHMVDVVIYFEGDKNFAFRLLRGVKNRFGSTDEIGLLEMTGRGLLEVADPSYIFLSGNHDASGTAVTASFEGRPFLIEVQALVAASSPGYPRRMASGIDQNRLALIIAVLEKVRGFRLADYDVYLKVTGGVFLRDPSVDLGIAAAIISSYKEVLIPPDTVFIGELGLSGQIRSVPFLQARLKEVEKMGFNRVIVPAGVKDHADYTRLELLEVKNIDQCIDIVMGG